MKRQAHAHMNIFAIKFHSITLLFLASASKWIEIEPITVFILLRSIGLSSSITICLLSSSGLEIREELFIDMIKVLLKHSLASFFLATLGLLIVILVFLLITVHVGETLVTFNVFIILLS